MAAAVILTRIGAVRAGLGVIELDCTVSAQHSARVEATTHPVEKGAKITDHLRPEPETVSIEGLISDTPANRLQPGVPGYAAAAYAKLLAIKDGGVLVTLATELRTYTSMALTSLDVPRDATVGDALRFSATFQKIILVENKVTAIRPATDPRARAKVKRGRTVLAKIQDKSKTFRKAFAPWKQPHAINDAATGISDRFHRVVFTSVGTGFE